MKRFALFCLFLVAFGLIANETLLFPVLKSVARIGKQSDGSYLLPTNQLLRPWGEQTVIAGRPVDLAMDSQEHRLAVLDTRSVVLLDAVSGARMSEVRTRSTSYTGIAFRPGDREIWASETLRNGPDAIAIIKTTATGAEPEPDRIALPAHPLPTGIAFSAEGALAYVAMSRANALAVIDASTRKTLQMVDVGIAPWAVTVSPKMGKIFVSNRGGRWANAGDATAWSSGAEVVVDPATGASSTGSISVVDIKTYAVKDVPVGLQPSNLALSPNEHTLAVANSHSDSVSFINTDSLERTDVKIPTWPDSTLGSQPVDVAFAPDGKTAYVACGGNNAIAVIRIENNEYRVEGAVPTGWFPSRISVDSAGSLRVVNIKGTGNTADKKGTFDSKEYEGLLTKMPAPLAPQVAAGTREVQAASTPKFEPMGGVADLTTLGIEHVFFIIKENRAYDQLFGDLPKGNGDPKLVMYGRQITPNHHALAEQYVLLDNFHTGGAISFDGHHWLMQAFVSDYVERAFAASPRGYAWNMSDALTVSPAGWFWQNAPKPLNVRIYGEFSLPAKWDKKTQSAVDIDEKELLSWNEYLSLYKENKWRDQVGSICGIPALQPFASQRYPFSTTSIPDQLRAAEFLEEFNEQVRAGTLPHINIITLVTDHTNGRRTGAPSPRSMVADDDVALGRIVSGISKSKVWAKSLILVVEDDAQDGVDHVDGHRTVALAIGPHIRRGAVDSTHYNHTSMVRTIQEIFRIPARTRFLASARAMHSVFTAEADKTPFEFLPNNVPLDLMNPPLQGLNGRQLWAARESNRINWRNLDDVPEDALNHILWWDARGFDTPYPSRRGGER